MGKVNKMYPVGILLCEFGTSGSSQSSVVGWAYSSLLLVLAAELLAGFCLVVLSSFSNCWIVWRFVSLKLFWTISIIWWRVRPIFLVYAASNIRFLEGFVNVIYLLVLGWITQGHPTTVFCKISVRRSKYWVKYSISWGWLKISRWPFQSCTIFEAYIINFLRFS